MYLEDKQARELTDEELNHADAKEAEAELWESMYGPQNFCNATSFTLRFK